MVFEKKQLSKVLAIALMVACAVAFMPLLSGQVFAASKVTGVKAKVSGTTATVTWKKVNKAKQYTVKVTGAAKKTVKAKKPKAVLKNLAAGDYKVKVKASKGAKTKWSKAVKFKIVAPVDKVEIAGEAVVGATLTATATDADGNAITEGVTYQWYRVNNSTGVVAAIPGATEASYLITAADFMVNGNLNGGYQIYVEATVGDKTVASAKTEIVSPGYYAQLNDTNDVAVTAPYVGQTVYADIYNAVTKTIVEADAEYQWYINGELLKGKTGYSFEITADELGKTIECKVIYRGKEYTTGVSAAVIESKMPTEVSITGASGVKADKTAVPAVGDALAAAFTKPEGAADADATYQWYVGSIAIKGETKATYTVQKEDIGSPISVEVTLSNKKVIEASTAAVVANKLSSADYTAVVVDKADAKNTVFTTDKTVKATIYKNSDTTKADVFADVAGNVEWYIDSVSVENQLWRDGDGAAKVAGVELPLTGTYGTSKDGKAESFKALENGLVGHTVIAVVYGNNTAYAGSVAATAIGPVGIAIAAPAVTLNGAAGGTDIIVGKTTLKAAFTDTKTTATYQWYKSTDNGANYTVIANATAADYAPTAQDAYDKVNMYKVTVKGNGNYVGEASTEVPAVFANSTEQASVTISIKDADGNAVTGTVRPGAVLTAAGDVDTAEATMTYKWTFTDVSAETTAEATGATYTVPATAETGDTITVAATNSNTGYALNQAAALTVKAEVLKSLTLTSVDAAGKKADPANPVIGDVITAKVDPANEDYSEVAWYYADEYAADPAKAATMAIGTVFNVTSHDIGKTVIAVATGKADYAGSTLTAETGMVKAKVEIVAQVNGQPITNDTILHVGDKITVTTGDYDEAVTAWNWTVNGSTPAEKNVYEIQNNDINGGNISITVAGPFTDDSTLTWTYRGTINQDGE